jgi:hypothetical protein
MSKKLLTFKSISNDIDMVENFVTVVLETLGQFIFEKPPITLTPKISIKLYPMNTDSDTPIDPLNRYSEKPSPKNAFGPILAPIYILGMKR